MDWYVLLTPLFALGVIALLGFTGCHKVFDLDHVDPVPPPPPIAMLTFEVQGNWHQRQVTVIGIEPGSYGTIGDFNRYLQHPENRKQLEFKLREGGYDALDRLIDMRQGSVTGTLLAQYQYATLANGRGGEIGNLTSKNEGMGGALPFNYDDGDHVHAPRNATANDYTYDHNGNLAARTGVEAFTFDVENLRFAVLDRDRSPESRDYAQNVAGSRYFVERPPIRDDAELERRMRSGELSLAIEIPPGYGRDLRRGRSVEIGVWIDGAMPTRGETIRGYVQGMHSLWLTEKAAHRLGQHQSGPATVATRFRYNPDVKSLVAMVPAVIPILLLLIPAMLAALSVVRATRLARRFGRDVLRQHARSLG